MAGKVTITKGGKTVSTNLGTISGMKADHAAATGSSLPVGV